MVDSMCEHSLSKKLAAPHHRLHVLSLCNNKGELRVRTQAA